MQKSGIRHLVSGIREAQEDHMMRLWVESYAKKTSVAPVGAMSFIVHALLIAAWVQATRPVESMPDLSFANRPYYRPPPDRVPGPRTPREQVVYVESTKEGPGAGEGVLARMMGDARPVAQDLSVGKTPPAPDTVQHVEKPNTPPPGSEDSVFSVLDVDTAVVRSTNSAAPAYPLKLLQAHVMGNVMAQYVVDTTGFADTSSFTVIKATHPEFIAAVKEALPYMRFNPAKIGPLKVKQLVEQNFSFKIADTVIAAPKVKRP
jgi:protein TonB